MVDRVPEQAPVAYPEASGKKRRNMHQMALGVMKRIAFWRKAHKVETKPIQPADTLMLGKKGLEYNQTEKGIDQITRYFLDQTDALERKNNLNAISQSSKNLFHLSPEQMNKIADFSKTLHISRIDLLTQVLLLSIGLDLEQMNEGKLTQEERSSRLYSRKSALVSDRTQEIIDQGKINLGEIALLLGLNNEQAQQLLMYRLDTPRSHIETQALQEYKGKIYPGNSQRIIEGADTPSADPRWDPVTTKETVGYRFGKYLGQYVDTKPDIAPIGDIVLPQDKRSLPFLSLALATTKTLNYEATRVVPTSNS